MMSDEQLNGIRAFIEVAQTGSFTLAGERLSRSRSAIGKAVSKLESRLGVRLLLRTTRKVKLTNEGLAFFERSLSVFNELGRAVDELHVQQQDVRGKLRLSIPVSFGRYWIMLIIQKLAHQYPELNFEINFSNKIKKLEHDDVDIAVRIGTLQDSMQFVARQLCMQNICLCASPDFLNRYPTPHKPEGLQYIPCLTSQPHQLWPLKDQQGEEHFYTTGNGMILDDIIAIRDAALAGLGIARLPAWLASPYICSGDLIALLPDSMPEGRPINVIWLAGKYLPYRHHIVIDTLVKHFSSSLPYE